MNIRVVGVYFSLFKQNVSEVCRLLIWQVFIFLGGVVGIKILTTLMSPEKYGEFSLGVSISGAICAFTFNPLGQVVGRFYSVYNSRGLKEVFFGILIQVYKKIAVLIFTLSIVSSSVIYYFISLRWALICFSAFGLSISTGTQSFFTSIFNAMCHRKTVNFIQALDVWFRVLFAISLVYLIKFYDSGLLAITGYILGALLALVWAYKLFIIPVDNKLIKIEAVDRRKFYKEFMNYGIPLVLFAGFAVINQFADRWLLQICRNTGEVGQYVVLYQIANIPIYFLMSLTNLLIPIIFSYASNRQDANSMLKAHLLYRRSITIILLISGLMIILSFLFGDYIIRLFASLKYLPDGNYLWIIVLALSLSNLAQFMNVYGMSLNSTKVYLWSKLGSSILFIVFGLFLGRYYGIQGIVYTLLITSIFSIISVFLTNKKIRINLK